MTFQLKSHSYELRFALIQSLPSQATQSMAIYLRYPGEADLSEVYAICVCRLREASRVLCNLYLRNSPLSFVFYESRMHRLVMDMRDLERTILAVARGHLFENGEDHAYSRTSFYMRKMEKLVEEMGEEKVRSVLYDYEWDLYSRLVVCCKCHRPPSGTKPVGFLLRVRRWLMRGGWASV